MTEDKKSFWKDNLAALGMIAGVLLTVIGGTMAVIGGYVGFTVHDSIRWDSITEQLGNMTANETTFTVALKPIDNDASVVKTFKAYNKSDCVDCVSGASAINSSCSATALAPCAYVSDADAGTVKVNFTGMFSDSSRRNAQVITADYSGVRSGTDLSNVYNKIMKALLILGVAFIVVGASVIFRELGSL